MTKKYTAISLFSGGCGLDLGFEKAKGFNILAKVDRDKNSCATMRKNRPDDLIMQEDISVLSPSKVLSNIEKHHGRALEKGELDVLFGGPPCQAFSIMGNRKSTSDPRGALLWHYVRFVRKLRPKFFVMENVPGILSSATEDGEGENWVVEEFVRRIIEPDKHGVDLGYSVDFFLVNAVNYGAPQIRQRVIAIGNRVGARFDFPSPTHHPRTSLKELFGDKQKTYKTVGEAFKDVPPSENWSLADDVMETYGRIQEGCNRCCLPGSEPQELHIGVLFRTLHREYPAYTVLTSPIDRHPTENRLLTVRECARLQGFPDDWEFSGGLKQQYKQVGNAVPVDLAYVAASLVKENLNKPTVGSGPRSRLVHLYASVKAVRDKKSFIKRIKRDNKKVVTILAR